MAVSCPKRRPKSGCWAMRVKWTEPALEDLAGIQAYIAKDSPYYAKQFIERIFEAAEALEDFPELGRKVPEAEATENIRELIFQSYRIMYLNQDNLVFILAVIHGSRDLASMEQKPWAVG
jgi:toxin ParE1/3/4